jgi:hypothetical protein
MYRASTAALAAAISVALAACAGNGEGLDENGRPIDGGPAPLEATLDSIQQNVFTPICTQCHIGAQAPAGLRLDETSSYAMLVNTPSTEVPSLRRVQAGNPDASYLIQKLQGTAAVGRQMPLNNPPLPQATIDVIRQWISDGAQPSAASSVDAMSASLSGVAPQAAEILDRPPREILIQATGQLDATRLTPANISLMRSGRDGSFNEGNEVPVDALRIELHSDQPTVLAILVPADQWVPDSYQLTVRAAGPAPVTDLAGEAIDGDADGTSGGDFVLQFELGGTL